MLALVHQGRKAVFTSLVTGLARPSEVYDGLRYLDTRYGPATAAVARCGLEVCVATTAYRKPFDDFPLLAVQPGPHGYRLIGTASSHRAPWGRYSGAGTSWACTKARFADPLGTWVTVPRASLVRIGVDRYGQTPYIVHDGRLVLWDGVVETVVARSVLEPVPRTMIQEDAARAWCAAHM